jgi:peptide-methionine (S)-S-oxide reductase
MNEATIRASSPPRSPPAKPFYYAEDDHQQYLHKNPYGYCGIGGIGVCLPPQA